MARYIIDIDLDGTHDDCSFCPMFHRELGSVAYCFGKEGGPYVGCEVAGELRRSGDHLTRCFDRPDWCPLVPLDRDEMATLVLDTLKEAYGTNPIEMIPAGLLDHAKACGIDVSDVGW